MGRKGIHLALISGRGIAGVIVNQRLALHLRAQLPLWWSYLSAAGPKTRCMFKFMHLAVDALHWTNMMQISAYWHIARMPAQLAFTLAAHTLMAILRFRYVCHVSRLPAAMSLDVAGHSGQSVSSPEMNSTITAPPFSYQPRPPITCLRTYIQWGEQFPWTAESIYQFGALRQTPATGKGTCREMLYMSCLFWGSESVKEKKQIPRFKSNWYCSADSWLA